MNNRDFFARFNIDIPLDEAKKAFVNRALNEIDQIARSLDDDAWDLGRDIASALGVRDKSTTDVSSYVHSFHDALRTLEVVYNQAPVYKYPKNMVAAFIVDALAHSEVDLGVRWHEAKFVRAGAAELDEALVNHGLHWLSQPQYANVRTSFSHALQHFLESTHNPARRKDVITDAYETLESLSKIVTNSDRDLSGNREQFIAKVAPKTGLKALLREYVDYGCEYRHGPGFAARPIPTEADTEAFLYLTGTFIRLATQALKAGA